MKILFITDLYPIRLEKERCAKTLHNFVFQWIKQGNEVAVIRTNFIFNSFLRGKSFFKKGFYEFEGVRIFNVNYHTPFLFDFEKKLSEEIKIADYDLIVAHMPSGIIFANKLAKKYKKPIVCGVHFSDLEVLTNPLYGIYFKKEMTDAYKRAKKIACRSFVLQKKFIEIFPQFADKTFVAASGVEEFGIEKSEVKRSSLNLLTCANLIKRKNIDKLITATKELEDFSLTIIGEGKEFKKLHKITSKKIKFLGKLLHEEVLEQMQKHNIFILPSVKETFGMVYLEAMASGCVVVCSKNDGIEGIIKEGENGFLTEPTVEGIKETLIRIKNCQNLEQIREKSLETVKKYTPEGCAQNYLENII